MNDQAAVERVGDLKWDSSNFKASIENLVVDYDEALKLAQELDAANAMLRRIVDKGGHVNSEGTMCNGSWCADLARRRLGVAE